jgi:hypothetical protein
MTKFNFSIYLNAYEDRYPSNAPSLNNFKWNRDLHSLNVNNPTNESLQAAPGSTTLLFSGTRTLAQDNTTAYSISLLPLTTNTYVFSWSGGTAPNFRTPRVIGSDATSQLTSSVNGVVETFTSGPGEFASFTGQIAGMPSPVTITADIVGNVGNSVVLSADGATNISTLISNWNTAHPLNMITLVSGNGSQIPNAPLIASFTGDGAGFSTVVTLTASDPGSIGNSIVLTGDGTSSINTLISNWNTANPSNQVSLTAGDGTQIPSGGAFAYYHGLGFPTVGITVPITLTADNLGQTGNSIELVGDGASSINTLIANWNSANPTNTVSLTAGPGGQIALFGSEFTLANGLNPGVIQLAGGLDANINLTGGFSATVMDFSTVQVGDFVTLGSNFNFSNQGTFQVIQTTANSFSIVNQTAVVEGPITLGADFATQLQIYSSTGVQVNDTLVISSGFSPVIQGSYEVTAVTANSLQFVSTSVLPQEGPIATEVVIYQNAKTLIYLESDAALSVIVNGVTVGTINPIVAINERLPSLPPSIFPGVFMFNTVAWSVSVQNNGLNTANVFFAAVE